MDVLSLQYKYVRDLLGKEILIFMALMDSRMYDPGHKHIVLSQKSIYYYLSIFLNVYSYFVHIFITKKAFQLYSN